MLIFLCGALAAAAAIPAAAPSPEPDLDAEILVTGKQASPFKAEIVQIGAFRNQSILDTPASVAVVPRAVLDAQQAQGLDDALRNTAGITQQSTSPTTTNNFLSRGVLMNARTNYRLNGALQIINLGPIPLENKQRVELLKGVSALYYGISTPSGIVNVVTKRAGPAPVTSFYGTGDDQGGVGGGVDIGRRFGPDQSFGARVNLYGARLRLPIDGVGGARYLASGAFDAKPSERLTLVFDIEQYRRASNEPGGLTLPSAVQGRITLPAIPDPASRYAPRGAPYRTWATNMLGRADYALGGGWSIRAEAGHARTRRQRTMANLLVTNPATGAGQVTASYTGDQRYTNLYWRAELAGTLTGLGVRHELLFGYARNRQRQADQHAQNYAPYAQSLTQPVTIDFAALRPTATRLTPGAINIDTGLYALDLAHVAAWLTAIGGVRHVDYATRAAPAAAYAIRTWTPTGGLVLRPSRRTSLYATYIEGLESAGTAPDGTVNAGALLAPVRSRQLELGARAEFSGALLSLAWFRINRGLSYTDLATNRYVVNGRQINRGVEASLLGGLGHGVSLLLSGQYLVARQARTGNPLQDGKFVDSVPKWSGSAFAEYRPSVLPALALNAGVYYTGRRFTDAQDRGVLPGYATLSLGSSYRIRTGTAQEVTLRLNADNVTNRRYWSTGGATLYVGVARVVRASAAVAL
ncbi:TonB-dependent receptor [Sphingomonas morindae]|uniref:TonB-dependent siderophore receptor n=1 Tax=Sphingomonas morindae TaxID=1541170 RepID=A0ABY4XDU3_9SPHN|nr:TonB-dependent siderophore receptor [Sphingomonas morindae]USI74886.1 TonB-dependent siderophore receptor [Sphingomonas morindae]